MSGQNQQARGVRVKGAVIIVLRVCVICVSLQGQPREASWSQCQRLPK